MQQMISAYSFTLKEAFSLDLKIMQVSMAGVARANAQ